MANYRTVSMGLWTDPLVEDDFKPEDKYFWLYILTNPHTNLCGCYEVSLKQMARETGYTEQTVHKLLGRFEHEFNRIRYDDRTKELLVLKWYRYNWSRSDKTIKAIDGAAQYVKSDAFRDYIYRVLSGYRAGTAAYPSAADFPCGEEARCPGQADDGPGDQKVKHKHGSQGNVLLTDEELEKLKQDFPDWQERIDRLSEYMAYKGAKYKSHYLTIRSWASRDAEKDRERRGAKDYSELPF